jgi:chromosome segregation ATPase
MSRDIKDLINDLDQKGQIESDFEITIRILKEEIDKLNFTIKEQKVFIQEQNEKLKKANDIPIDIKLLKDLVVSQRQELKTKDNDIQIFEQKIKDLNNQLNVAPLTPENYNDYMNAKKVITDLTQENELLKLNESNAKKLITDLMLENDNFRSEIQTYKQQIENNKTLFSDNEKLQLDILSLNNEALSLKEQLEVAKKVSDEITQYKHNIDALTEKYNLVGQDNEKLKYDLGTANNFSNRLTQEIEGHLKEIANLNQEINSKETKNIALNERLNVLEKQNIELSQQLGELSKLKKEEIAKLDNTNKDLLNQIEKLRQDSINLNNVISELLIHQNQLQNDIFKFNYALPKFYQTHLFLILFQLLEKDKKELLFQALINDLSTIKSNDSKRFIIDIISNLNDDRVYEIFKKLIFDEDWLIRLFIIKALNKLDIKKVKDHFFDILNQLLNDKDSDVIESTRYLLSKLP